MEKISCDSASTLMASYAVLVVDRKHDIDGKSFWLGSCYTLEKARLVAGQYANGKILENRTGSFVK